MGTALIAYGAAGCSFHRSTCIRRSSVIANARKQGKKSRREQQQKAEGLDPVTTRLVLENVEQELPQAPSPRTRTPQQSEMAPGDIYPVFAPRPGTAANAPWRWEDGDDDESDSATEGPGEELPEPAWNPRTGFMRTAAELRAAQEATAANSGTGGSPSGAPAAAGTAATSSGGANREASVPSPSASSPAAPASKYTVVRASSVEVSLTVPPADPLPSAPTDSGPAPLLIPASRNAVLSSALGAGFWMVLLAVVFRNFAALAGSKALGTDPEVVAELLRWPLGLESLVDVGAAAGAAAVVTAARLALLSVWGDLRDATERSNKQVLTNLSPADILLVAVVSGVPEELLFRGALLPATFPDWRGVLLSAAIFGLLHNSGGRNPAFAVWAGGVGAVYGAAYLATGNVWVPALAHSAANAMSAFVWKAREASGGGKEQ